MPSTSCLVDRNGRPVSSSLYRTPSQVGGDVRPVAKPRAPTYEAISAWQRREMVDVSRVIAAGVPNIDTALIQAGEFSVGDSWHIKSRSTNKKWGAQRDEWFNQFYSRDCNARGRMNDWRSTLRQLNWTRKVQADYGIVFDGAPVKDPLTGKERAPTGKFQIIKYDRISSAIGGSNGVVSVGNGLEQVKTLPRNAGYYSAASTGYAWPGIYIINDPASRFDGYYIIDGVIMDQNMVSVGKRVTGYNAKGQPTYVDLPDAQIHFNFSARKDTDYIRGVPEIAESILPNMNLDDIQYLVSMAVKLASALAITRVSEDGNPSRAGRANYDEDIPNPDPNGAATITTKRSVEEIFPGIIELAANKKEELKALSFNRPSMNEESFVERVETSVLHKLWPRSLIYSESAGRAGMRAIGIQANTICTWDQMCLERDARWIGDRSTEFSMRAGYIGYNDNLYDPYNYGFTVPAKFTVDEGNDAKMRLMALGRCVISRGMICELDGYLAEEIEEQRAAEEDRLCAAAETLSKKYSWLTPKEALMRLDSGGSNLSFSDTTQADSGAAEDGLPSETKKIARTGEGQN